MSNISKYTYLKEAYSLFSLQFNTYHLKLYLKIYLKFRTFDFQISGVAFLRVFIFIVFWWIYLLYVGMIFHLAVADDIFDGVFLCFSPRGVLDEIRLSQFLRVFLPTLPIKPTTYEPCLYCHLYASEISTQSQILVLCLLSVSQYLISYFKLFSLQ